MTLLTLNVSILCFFIAFGSIVESTVTVTNESGGFIIGKTTSLKCTISSYGGGMIWRLDGTIIAQCAFSSCNALGALPTGDIFTYNESRGEFFLHIGITHADNGTKYECDDGSNQDYIVVNENAGYTTDYPWWLRGTSDQSVQVRLVGGSYYYGRVEVYYQGRWGTICDDEFDHNDAKVICRMIGHYYGSEYGVAYHGSQYGRGYGPILLDNVECNGYENDISQCISNGWYNHDCDHSEDVGVNCREYNGYTTEHGNLWWNYKGTTDYPYETTSQSVQVRLVDGDTYYRGRVEVYYQGQWGTICDDSFDHNDVKVICRMLGLYRGSSYGVAYSAATFCPGSGSIMLDDLQCSGNEYDISQCRSSGWHNHNCGHQEDAGVDCYEYIYGSYVTSPQTSIQCNQQTTYDYNYQTTDYPVQVRLADGDNYHSGRVEVYYQGQWGTICDDGFGYNDMKVICRMLGLYRGSNYGVAYDMASFCPGSGSIMLDNLQCNGNEHDISQCGSRGWYQHSCNHHEDAGVDCYEYNYGRFTIKRSTRCHQNTTTTPDYNYQTTDNPVRVRLTGGSYYYGRVEVYYQGQWGTICDDNFDHNDAKVICRMLGQYRGSNYGVAYTGAYYGEGRGPIVIDDLNCYGYESDISQCTSRTWLTSNCGHKEDAGVNCHEYYQDTTSPDWRPWWYHETTTEYPYWFHGTSSSPVRVRLVNGGYYYGRVEVYYQGQWGTICDDNFDHNDVKVICRMLGQYRGSDYGVAYQQAQYGSGRGPITVDELRCNGYESDITQCSSNPWYSHDCSHSEDASLNCHAYYYETSTYPSRITTPWWYRQTTSGYSIQDAILVTCDEAGWDIRIDMYKLRLIYPDARASDIYLGENHCNGIESWSMLRFNQGLRECLTQEMIRNNQLVYSNELIYAEHDPHHPYIIRHYNWTVGVECDVSSNETSSGHIDHNSNHGSYQHVSGESHFSVNMMFYTDPNYQYKLQYPLSVTVGQEVYVKVFTNATDWNIRMRVHTCYTKPSEHASDNLKYYLLKNGCEVDSNTHIISQSSHETRFVFQDFEYTHNQQGIHVFCDAKFCAANDYSRDCMQACNPIIRRNVIYRPGDQELDTAVPGDPIDVNVNVESIANGDVAEDPGVINDDFEDDTIFYNAVVVDYIPENDVTENPIDMNETTDAK
ncbi:Scavenger receptor Cys-rich [Mactra antiquata]